MLILLLDAMPDGMLGVPGLGGDGDKIGSGIQVAEVVVAFVIGVSLPGEECPASSARKNLVEERDIGLADRIAGLVGNVSGNGSAGPQPENQIFGFGTWADDDRGGEAFVLLIHLREVTAMAGGKDILAGRHAGESKRTFRIRDFDAARIRRVGGIGRIRRIDINRRARKRLAGDGIKDSTADSKGDWRGRSRRGDRRRGGLLEGRDQKEKRQEWLGNHAGYSPTFTNWRSILADCSGDSVTSRALERYFLRASGFAYSSRSG